MNPNPWLIAIVPVILAAVLGAVLSPSMARAVLALARARAQRVKYVPVSGTYLYANGVPLTEKQFREAFAAINADLDRLSPPAERSEWEMSSSTRLSIASPCLPACSRMPTRSAATQTMHGPGTRRTTLYAASDLPRGTGWRLQPPGDIVTDWSE
jgi:hypothetical protein